MSVIGEIAGAVAVIATPVGALGAFVWNKLEKRFTKIEDELEKCRAGRSQDQERRSTQVSVIELLWAEVMRLAPDSHTLRRADKLMNDLKQKTQDVADAENGE